MRPSLSTLLLLGPSTTSAFSLNMNRGANAAKHNRLGHNLRQKNKEQKTVRKMNTKRPPRWEREGDQLYVEVSKKEEDEARHLQLLDNAQFTAQDVCTILKPYLTDGAPLNDCVSQKIHETSDVMVSEEHSPTAPYLWGPLPVGPVLASRLYSHQRRHPTSIQKSAFSILTASASKTNQHQSSKKTNAIIASPTGTGKTLAYLLPLLCTSPGGQYAEGTGGVLIVTPTIELACQIQREVNVLWPPTEKEGYQSSLFVVGADDIKKERQGDKEDREEYGTDEQSTLDTTSQSRIILRSLQKSPLIAGTPKMLRMLYREAQRIVHQCDHDSSILEEERVSSVALLTNLRAIVLDEADRLLRTEAVAREETERKERKLAKLAETNVAAVSTDDKTSHPLSTPKKTLIIARQTQTELLLRDLPIPSLNNVQIICASATVGRTMRRQLMQILDAPSAEAAAVLITGEEDPRVKSKDAKKRMSVLLPEKLHHAFRVVTRDLVEESRVVTDEMSHLSLAEQNEENMICATIKALWDTMTSIETPRPMIIFPGKLGVARVQIELIARGIRDVRTLRNLDGRSPETSDESNASSTSKYCDEENGWKSIPVYLVGERFARGLDLPGVEYVILLNPPSSAAAYVHLAGRTGRNDQKGTAITLLRSKHNEIKRFVAIAETLGLKFDSSFSGIAESMPRSKFLLQREIKYSKLEEERLLVSAAPHQSHTYPWYHLSESVLRRKKNADLLDYLQKFGTSMNFQDLSTKADMVSAIQTLHSVQQS